MKYYYFGLILLAGATLAPQIVSAQNFEGLGGQSSSITINTSPKRPKPNQLITVSIESFSTDLNRAEISWFLNGTEETGATGRKSFQFETGGPGSVSNILVVVKSPDSGILQQSLNIRPATVDVIWEAQSYTPPFYQGKALYPFQGTVKVVAMPNIVTENGSPLNPKNLVYSWRVNGNPATDASGYGKNYIFFAGGIPLKPAKITVEVSSLDQVYAAEGDTSFSPIQPQIIFYEDNPLLGILYNKALTGRVKLQNQEIKIAAIPYFTGSLYREGRDLSYGWQMNNKPVTTLADGSGLTFRQNSGTAGTASVSLEISNPSKIFQTTRGDLSLSFGGNQSASPF